MAMFVNGIEIPISVPKEYSEDEIMECLMQIKQKYGDLYVTMFGCTCKMREYVNKIISAIDENNYCD